MKGHSASRVGHTVMKKGQSASRVGHPVIMKASVVLIVLLAAVAAEKTSKTVTFTCEEDYTMVGTECYFVSPESHAGTSADNYCSVKGGHAAIVESQEEMDLLKETLLNTTVYR